LVALGSIVDRFVEKRGEKVKEDKTKERKANKRMNDHNYVKVMVGW